MEYEQTGSRSEDFAPRHGPAAERMPQAARLHEIAEVPEGSPAPVAASASWAFAILVVGTSPGSKAPRRRPHQDAGELHVALVCQPPALQPGTRAFFALWDGVGAEYRVPRMPKTQPEVALPCGSQASAAKEGNEGNDTSSVVDIDPTNGPPKLPSDSTLPVPPSPSSPGSPDPPQGDHKHPPAPAGEAAGTGVLDGTGGDEVEAVQDVSSEEDSESAAETVESDTADPANDEAAPVVVAPDVDAVMGATHVAQVVGDAVHLPMITIKLDDRALAPAAPLVQSPTLKSSWMQCVLALP